MLLSEVATVIRSKTAGPFELTLDVFFDDEESFAYARDSGALTAAAIARLYGRPASSVLSIHFFRPALAFKATLARSAQAGSVGDTDVFGAQQYIPLLSLSLPPRAGVGPGETLREDDGPPPLDHFMRPNGDVSSSSPG